MPCEKSIYCQAMLLGKKINKKGKDVGLNFADTTAYHCYHIFLHYKGELHSNDSAWKKAVQLQYCLTHKGQICFPLATGASGAFPS